MGLPRVQSVSVSTPKNHFFRISLVVSASQTDAGEALMTIGCRALQSCHDRPMVGREAGRGYEPMRSAACSSVHIHMSDINYLAVLAGAASRRFVLSAIYYGVLGGQLARLSAGTTPSAGGCPALQLRTLGCRNPAQPGRGCRDCRPARPNSISRPWPGGHWAGAGPVAGDSPVVLLAGSVFHERYPGAARGDPRRRLAAEARGHRTHRHHLDLTEPRPAGGRTLGVAHSPLFATRGAGVGCRR